MPIPKLILDLTRDSEGQKKDSPINLTDESSLVAGTRISSIAFRMDVNEGLTRKSSDRFAFHLFTFPSAFESKLSALPEMQKASQILTGFSL
ncbi:MAG: hypothetical protein ACKO6A_02570 [Bacteroidota bacterium]